MNGLILKSKKGPFEQLDGESCNSQCIGTAVGRCLCDNLTERIWGLPAGGIPCSTRKVETHNIVIFCIR